MKKIILTLFAPLALIFGLQNPSVAQNSDYRMGIELNGGFMEYQGDHGHSLFFSKKPIYNGVGANISNYISPSFDLMLFGKTGDVGFYKDVPFVAPPFDYAGFTARLFNVSAGLKYKFNNDIILPSTVKLFPYLIGGWGFQYIHSRIYNLPRNLTEFTGVWTGGAGLQYDINDRWGLRLQSTYNYTYNDIWDGSPFTGGAHKRNKLYDAYMYHSIGVVYNFDYDLIKTDKGSKAKKPKKIKIEKIDLDKILLATEGIYFETDQSVIKEESYPNLDTLVMILNKYPDLNVVIEGHTDNTGSKEHNKTLSQDRADAVKQYLIDKGINTFRLTAIGYGDERPVADNDTPEGRAKNRRVEFKPSN